VLNLNNKKILVAGLGNETGDVFLQTFAGWGATVTGIDCSAICDEKVKLQSNTVSLVPIDFYDMGKIPGLLSALIHDIGPFQGFVFNGGLGGVRPLSMTTPDFAQEMIAANTLTFIELVRILVKNKGIENGSGIVAVSSVSSIKGLKSKIAYSASKAALDAAVRSMAAEMSAKKIRVNSLLKGWITSDMTQDFIENNRQLNKDEDFKKQLLGPSTPDELANLAAFLLSDAVPTLTGSAILLDGGYSL